MIFVKEFTTGRDGIDQQIIKFLAEKNIKKEDLIDIKYTFSVSAHGTGYSGALVIYEKRIVIKEDNMSKVYFIADTHFAEQDVFEMSGENRFFDSVLEKDEAIIANWNRTVTPEDTVFILGDFGKPSYMERLNGKKFLIKGNHDGHQMVDSEYPILYKNFFILSHEPQFILEDGPYANIFGHVHNNPIYKTVTSRSYCVCACRNNWTPVPWEYIIESMRRA